MLSLGLVLKSFHTDPPLSLLPPSAGRPSSLGWPGEPHVALDQVSNDMGAWMAGWSWTRPLFFTGAGNGFLLCRVSEISGSSVPPETFAHLAWYRCKFLTENICPFSLRDRGLQGQDFTLDLIGLVVYPWASHGHLHWCLGSPTSLKVFYYPALWEPANPPERRGSGSLLCIFLWKKQQLEVKYGWVSILRRGTGL